jgi:hypothetical protein
MSGAVAAHAAYNGSGTQGLAVTNKITGNEGDVMSVFWNKNDTTRQLLHGSSIIEIPISGNGNSASLSSIFQVNNDIDAIGDLYLQISATTGSAVTYLDSTLVLAKLIKRIEFQVGTQIWQTLELADILSLVQTETSPSAFEHFVWSTSGGVNQTGAHQIIDTNSGSSLTPSATWLYGTGKSTTGDVRKLNCAIKIPCLSSSLGAGRKFADVTENAYLLAAAPFQQVKIKVILESAKIGSVSTQCSAVSLKLFGQHLIMCNEEREQVKNMPMGIPKRIKMTQNVTTTLATSSTTATIDLDSFSLFSSHLIIRLTATSTTVKHQIKTAEIKLNSSSFSGELEGAMLTGVTSDTLGLYFNQLYLVNENVGDYTYIFPFASKAYGGSSVPLNRFDNIRLILTLATATAAGCSVSVTCVGETTALYKGRASSLAMY